MYGSDYPTLIEVQYLWGKLQAHRVMNYFLWKKLCQHPEVDSHIKLYPFKHRHHPVEVSDFKQRMETQDKTLNQM